MTTPAHAPIERSKGIVDCACGWRQEGVFVENFGARVEYLTHVVQAIGGEQGWQETFYAEVYTS